LAVLIGELAAREEEEEAARQDRRRVRRERHERYKRERNGEVSRGERGERSERRHRRDRERERERQSHSESDSTSDDDNENERPKMLEAPHPMMSGALGDPPLPSLASTGLRENPNVPGQYLGYTRNPPPLPSASMAATVGGGRKESKS